MRSSKEFILDALEQGGDHVNFHMLNNSASKQQYSFSKAPRFKAKTEMSDSQIYKYPQAHSIPGGFILQQKRKTYFHLDMNPAPNKYQYSLDGQISSRVIGKPYKRFHFGLGRSQIKINSFLTLNNHEVPSPLAYNPEKSQSGTKAITFGKARKIQQQKEEFENVGPGSYKVQTCLNEQKQFLSNRFRSLCPKIQRTIYSRKNICIKSPALYCPSITSRGQLLNLSNLNRGVSIGKKKRSTSLKIEAVPGPGHYSTFSEFIKGKN